MKGVLKSITIVLFLGAVAIIATTAEAGVLDTIKAMASASSIWVGIGILVLGYVLKRIPNEKIQAFVGKFAYGLGVTMTLGLSKWKWSQPFWAATIEPYFIDLVDNTIGTFTKQFIEGLRSDNG